MVAPPVRYRLLDRAAVGKGHMPTSFVAEDAPAIELASRAATNDEAAIRSITGRYNRRLHRLARSILRDDDEAEDAVQLAYLKAFAAIGGFRGDAELGTWLSRIVINVALDMRNRERVTVRDDAPDAAPERASEDIDPERAVAQHEIRVLLERAIDALPQVFRTVLIARA